MRLPCIIYLICLNGSDSLYKIGTKEIVFRIILYLTFKTSQPYGVLCGFKLKHFLLMILLLYKLLCNIQQLSSYKTLG